MVKKESKEEYNFRMHWSNIDRNGGLDDILWKDEPHSHQLIFSSWIQKNNPGKTLTELTTFDNVLEYVKKQRSNSKLRDRSKRKQRQEIHKRLGIKQPSVIIELLKRKYEFLIPLCVAVAAIIVPIFCNDSSDMRALKQRIERIDSLLKVQQNYYSTLSDSLVSFRNYTHRDSSGVRGTKPDSH